MPFTDSEINRRYRFGAGTYLDWEAGSRLEVKSPKAEGLLGEGEVLEVDRPRRLVTTMVALWGRTLQVRVPLG